MLTGTRRQGLDSDSTFLRCPLSGLMGQQNINRLTFRLNTPNINIDLLTFLLNKYLYFMIQWKYVIPQSKQLCLVNCSINLSVVTFNHLRKYVVLPILGPILLWYISRG